MIGLDTNVIVRYLTQDDPVQSRRATEILEQRLTAKKPGFVCVVTMVELVWVLDRACGLTAQQIAAALERMLQTDVLLIENEKEVFTAMIALKERRGTFADALIAALGAKAGCKHTLTFGQNLCGCQIFSPRKLVQAETTDACYFTSASTRAGPPEPFSSLIGATTTVAPFGGTNPRFATFSNW
jgi:predicted nucleic-acid-binding protein